MNLKEAGLPGQPLPPPPPPPPPPREVPKHAQPQHSHSQRQTKACHPDVNRQPVKQKERPKPQTPEETKAMFKQMIDEYLLNEI